MRRIGCALLLILIIFSLAFGGTGDVDAFRRLLPPSLEFPFGTDTMGRSLIERTAGGVMVSIAVAASVTALSLLAGIAAAFCFSFPRLSPVILAVSDCLKAVPSIILALFLSSISGPGIPKLIAAIALSHAADLARTLYPKVRMLQAEPFIEAERGIGAGRMRIFVFHIMPHLKPYLSLQSVSVFLSSVLEESTLSFLGCGVPVPVPSLGSVLSEVRPVMLSAPWAVFFPAAALLLLSVSLCLIALSLSEPDAASE